MNPHLDEEAQKSEKRFVRRLRLPLPIVVGTLALAARAHAAEESMRNDLDAPAERRSGVLLGADVGFGLAASSGYPNSATKIDDPAYFAASGLMVGRSETFFLMGALTDYLNFGLWGGAATFESSDWRSTGGGGGVRVEAFPLYAFYPRLKDLGVVGQFGIGSTTLTPKNGTSEGADGTQSFIGVGLFYEWSLAKLLGGHVAVGPKIDYVSTFSQAIERHGATLSVRLAFYGGM